MNIQLHECHEYHECDDLSRVVSRKSYFDKHLGKLQSKYNFDNDSNIVVMSKYVEMSKCCRNV